MSLPSLLAIWPTDMAFPSPRLSLDAVSKIFDFGLLVFRQLVFQKPRRHPPLFLRTFGVLKTEITFLILNAGKLSILRRR
jgi:hypothetical protein